MLQQPNQSLEINHASATLKRKHEDDDSTSQKKIRVTFLEEETEALNSKGVNSVNR